MSFFNLEVLKRKPTKFRWIDPCKTFKNICFWEKEIEKKTKIATHMNLWKYDQILTIQKSITIKRLRFSNKIFFIWICHLYYIIYWVPITNFECESKFFFFNFCNGLVRWPVHNFQLQKFNTTNKWVFLSINNHTILFIMNLLDRIQVLISKFKDILITICIWTMGALGKVHTITIVKHSILHLLPTLSKEKSRKHPWRHP
jgi:hypothetical protein